MSEKLPQAVSVNGNSVFQVYAEAINPLDTSTSPINLNHNPDYIATKELLNTKHWPIGYQNFLMKSVEKVPYRFFICDDSGSMSTNDGRHLVGSGTTTKEVNCSRWAELGESIRFHAVLSKTMNVPSEFRLLNTGDPVTIGGSESNRDGLSVLLTMLNDSPGGGTPLCRHIREVIAKVRELEPMIRSLGQKVAIIIITDGEASDGDLMEAMAPLKLLHVRIVIRLCTNDVGIMNYWNKIDQELEMNIDILDDMLSEAAEVISVNPWLNYCEPIHRMREFGIPIREMDMLDERLLSFDELRVVCSIIFNYSVIDIPHPQLDFKAFKGLIADLCLQSPKAYCLGRRKTMPLIDMRALNALYCPRMCLLL